MARRLAARTAVARTAPSDHEVLQWLPDAVVVSLRDGTIVFVNRQAETLTGYRRDELIGRSIELLVPVKQRSTHEGHRTSFYESDASPRLLGGRDHDFLVRRKDGTNLPVDITLGPVGAGTEMHTIAVLRDIAERRKLEHALEHRALHDPLTNLANRTLFFDRFRQSLHTARRENEKVALVMLDLDDFKEVNDAHGHSVGDEALKKVAARLRLGLRATDTAARLGGDEFAWILPDISSHASVEMMVRDRLANVKEPIQIGDLQLSIGVSAGIALYPDDGRDVDSLMRHADSALYAAKKAGNGLLFYG